MVLAPTPTELLPIRLPTAIRLLPAMPPLTADTDIHAATAHPRRQFIYNSGHAERCTRAECMWDELRRSVFPRNVATMEWRHGMRAAKLITALVLLGAIHASPVLAGRGHGHGHHHGGHHHHGGGWGGFGLGLGMGMIGYGMGSMGRAPYYSPSYGYPPVGYGANYYG